MAENTAKRVKTGDSVTIGTHNGHFHADEALAVYLLRRHIPLYEDAQLVRTRDPKVLDTCHTVVDVGGAYDPDGHRYDHHQRGFAITFPGRPTKLSSAGLIYKHFGHEIIMRRLLRGSEVTESISADKKQQVMTVWSKLYENFVEALDAHDNGISIYDASALEKAGLEKRFSDGGFHLGAMVGRLNLNWNDDFPEDVAVAQKLEDSRFEMASQRIGEEFDRDLDYYTQAWLPARGLVSEAFASRSSYDQGGRIMVMKGQSAPWKDHLYALEEDSPDSGKVLYVLYSERPKPDAKWRLQCVPVSKDSFDSRKPLPEAWRGLRDEELDAISGVPGCVFVHASGFIGGNKSFEGALALAKKALEL